MNLLFEIPDKLLIIIGIIATLLIAIAAAVYKISNRKVKPISDEERYDKDEIEIKEIPKEELTDEQREAKEELQRVFSQMSEDLEKQKKAEEGVEVFEREQEENAIISYQELMKQAEKLKAEADKYERKAEKVADTKVVNAFETYEREIKRQENKEPEKPKGFKNSDIISPIYGIQSNKNMIRQKNSSNKQKSDIIKDAYEEKRRMEETQNLEFLQDLKKFRRNL